MRYESYEPPVLFAREPETVGAYDAKTRLPELLAAVEAGASFVITRHGHPIARLLPLQPKAEGTRLVEAILARREGQRLGVPLRTLIVEGRK